MYQQKQIVVEMKNINITVFWMLILFLSSCANDKIPSLARPTQAIGMINHATIVADKTIWEGFVGDSLRNNMEAPYPILPQPEPTFNIQHFTAQMLQEDPNKRHLKTMIFLADLSDTNSLTTSEVKAAIGAENVLRAKEDPKFSSVVGRDKWARGQLIIYVFGFGEQQLAQNIARNYPAIAKRIKAIYAEMLDAQTYVRGHHRSLTDKIKSKFEVAVDLPADYQLAIEDDNFMWLRKETKVLSSNIMLYKIPYAEKEQLSNEGLKSIRNELGKKYIATTIEGTYMKMNDIDLPVFYKNKTLNNNFTIEARGIWDIKNDYMGGPFLSYLIHNPDKSELLYVDGFVHAPGQKKRNYMQHLELIFASIKF